MTKLKMTYGKESSIPEQFRELYSPGEGENEGKFILTGIDVSARDNDLFKLKNALEMERSQHMETKKVLGGMEEKLSAAAAGGDQDKEAMVRELEETRKGKAEQEAAVARLRENIKRREIDDKVKRFARKHNVLDSALEDIMMISGQVFDVTERGDVFVKEGSPFTSGNSLEGWISEVKEQRPHWWGATRGGGSQGSGSAAAAVKPRNPDGSLNLSELAKVYADNMDMARRIIAEESK